MQMSQFEDRYKNHPVHTTLANLLEILKREELKTDNTNIMSLVDRIGQAADYCNICLENVLPALVTSQSLDQMNNHIQSIFNETNAYISNKNEGHLNNAGSHIDNLMNVLSGIPIPRPKLAQNTFTGFVNRFKDKVEEAINILQTDRNKLETGLAEVNTSLAERVKELNHLAEKLEQNSKAADDYLASFNSQLSSQKESFEQRLNNLIESNRETQESFLQNQEELNEALRTRSEEEYKTHRTHQSAAFTGQIESLKAATSDAVEELERKRVEASNLVQIIGNIGITGNYQKVANSEKESADRWRNIALILMLGMVGVIGLTIFTSLDGFDWRLALFRIGAALILAIPATYAARESSKHRQLENYNRQAELELASLDPFLEKLPTEVQDKIKEELTTKFFGLNSQKPNENENVSKETLIDMIKTVLKK